MTRNKTLVTKPGIIIHNHKESQNAPRKKSLDGQGDRKNSTDHRDQKISPRNPQNDNPPLNTQIRKFSDVSFNSEQRKQSAENILRKASTPEPSQLPRSGSFTEENLPKKKWYQRRPTQESTDKIAMQRNQSTDAIVYPRANIFSDSIQRNTNDKKSTFPNDIPAQRSFSNESTTNVYYAQPRHPKKSISEEKDDRDKSSTSYESKHILSSPSMSSYRSDGSQMQHEYRRKMSFGGSAGLGSLSEGLHEHNEEPGNPRNGISDSARNRLNLQNSDTAIGGARRGSAEAMLQLLQDEIESMYNTLDDTNV